LAFSSLEASEASLVQDASGRGGGGETHWVGFVLLYGVQVYGFWTCLLFTVTIFSSKSFFWGRF
jgi:hypothetical protein